MTGSRNTGLDFQQKHPNMGPFGGEVKTKPECLSSLINSNYDDLENLYSK